MKISVLLPAAGLGRRFAAGGGALSTSGGLSLGISGGSKVGFELLHKPVFLRAIELFQGRLDVVQILLAVRPGELEDFRFRWGDQLAFEGVTLIAGGEAERWETVQIALGHVAEEATHVAVHDAARPCASGAMIDRVFDAGEKYGAAVPGVAMGDTVKRVLGIGGWGLGDEAKGEDRGGGASGQAEDPLDALFGGGAGAAEVVGKVCETVSRNNLWRVQTPQVFEKGLLVDAYGKLNADNAEGVTDDASVVERAGGEVVIVEGDAMNIKLTTPGDVELMEAVLKMREEKDARSKAEKALFGDDED